MKQTGKVSAAGSPAFTLVELLVVLGIMSLLGGIGFSGIQAIRRSLDDRAEAAFFMEIQTACRLYYLEHAKWPLTAPVSEMELTGADDETRSMLAPYMETRLTQEALEREFDGKQVFIVLDDDRDHWIRPDDFVALESGLRPESLWERCVVYSLDTDGSLNRTSWP